MLIYSKKNKKKILGVIFRSKKITSKRIDISPENEFLQFSAQKLTVGNYVKPHIHKKIYRKSDITQEIWIVIKGKLLLSIYDIDKKVIKKTFLEKGDLYILFRGGHTFKVIKKNTIFYEVKNGPYYYDTKDITYF